MGKAVDAASIYPAAILGLLEKLQNTSSATQLEALFQELIESFGYSFFCVRISSPLFGTGRTYSVIGATPGASWLSRWMQSGGTNPGFPGAFDTGKVSDTRVSERVAMTLAPDGTGREFGVLKVRHLPFDMIWRAAEVLLLSKQAMECPNELALQTLSAFGVLKFLQIAKGSSSEKGILSNRERECLRWVAAGKTDWELSRILGISEKTAQEHVGRALVKLGAATRAHAVARAITDNLIC